MWMFWNEMHIDFVATIFVMDDIDREFASYLLKLLFMFTSCLNNKGYDTTGQFRHLDSWLIFTYAHDHMPLWVKVDDSSIHLVLPVAKVASSCIIHIASSCNNYIHLRILFQGHLAIRRLEKLLVQHDN